MTFVTVDLRDPACCVKLCVLKLCSKRLQQLDDRSLIWAQCKFVL
jgi:hypothetical protein